MLTNSQNSKLELHLQSSNVDEKTSQLITRIFTERLTTDEIVFVENSINDLSVNDQDGIVRAIFQIAEELNFPINKSSAAKGKMGVANYLAQRAKNLKVFIRGYYFNKKAIRVVAEGDSWFEHAFITDIIDWLIRKTNLRIYPMAYGGDWIGNYLEKQSFIEKLKEKNASVFLLSGGGNDIVGDIVVDGKDVPRLQMLLKNERNPIEQFNNEDINSIINNSGHSKYTKELATSILIGRQFWKDEFHILFNIFRFQYLLILRLVDLVDQFKVISQGYDFAIPNSDKHNLFRKFLGHGSWLSRPLVNLNIDQKYHKDIINSMMHEFNVMLIDLSEVKHNFYFIDCRFAANSDQWNDELHLHSSVYEKIADTFIECIHHTDSSIKVFKVAQ